MALFGLRRLFPVLKRQTTWKSRTLATPFVWQLEGIVFFIFIIYYYYFTALKTQKSCRQCTSDYHLCVFINPFYNKEDQQHTNHDPFIIQETFSFIFLFNISYPVAREDFPLVSIRKSKVKACGDVVFKPLVPGLSL